jgi:hypothetical protein
MTRTILPIAAAALLAVPGVGRAVEEAREVPVGDLTVAPLGDLAPANDHLDLHLVALLGARADSRLLSGSDDSEDVMARGLAGIDWRYAPDETSAAHLGGAIEGRRYVAHRELDGLGGNAGVDWIARGLMTTVGATASWARSDELLLDTGERLISDVFRVGAEAERRQLDTHFSAAFEAGRNDYRDGGVLFDDDDHDSSHAAVHLRLAWDYAREAFLFSHTRFDGLLYDHHELFDDSVGASQSVGWERRIGERSAVAGEVGVVARRFLGRGGEEPDTRLAPFALGTLDWPWEEGSRLRGRIFSDLQDTATRGATWVYGTAWELRWRLAIATHLLVSGGVQQWRDSETPPGGARETRTVSEARVGVEHHLRAGWTCALFAGWLDSSAEVGTSYHDFSGTGELAFAY